MVHGIDSHFGVKFYGMTRLRILWEFFSYEGPHPFHVNSFNKTVPKLPPIMAAVLLLLTLIYTYNNDIS